MVFVFYYWLVLFGLGCCSCIVYLMDFRVILALFRCVSGDLVVSVCLRCVFAVCSVCTVVLCSVCLHLYCCSGTCAEVLWGWWILCLEISEN